jgi:hypothetical protein
MKKLFFIPILVFTTLSCKKENSAQSEIKNASNNINQPIEDKIYEGLYGSWVGEFVAEEFDNTKEFVNVNKINILLKSITKKGVTGLSIVAGNMRDLNGEIIDKNGVLEFKLKEPGNAKQDGIFNFKLINDTLIGLWTANDKKIAVTKRSFKLTRTKFVYNTHLMLPLDDGEDDENDYTDYYNSKNVVQYEDEETGEKYMGAAYRTASDMIFKLNGSTQKLSEENLKELKKIDLEIIRNTIFARHGYTFKKKTFRQFFDYVDWYVPVSDDVSVQLTNIEKENIALLKKFEKYAEDNYDTFGR